MTEIRQKSPHKAEDGNIIIEETTPFIDKLYSSLKKCFNCSLEKKLHFIGENWFGVIVGAEPDQIKSLSLSQNYPWPFSSGEKSHEEKAVPSISVKSTPKNRLSDLLVHVVTTGSKAATKKGDVHGIMEFIVFKQLCIRANKLHNYNNEV